MSTEEFRRRLAAEIEKVGGDHVVSARLRERLGFNAERARGQVRRALHDDRAGLGIRRNVVSMLDIPLSQKREMLELSEDDPIAPQLAAIRGVQLSAAIRSFNANVWSTEWLTDQIFCEPQAVRLILSNLSTKLVAVTSMHLDVSCKQLDPEDLPGYYVKPWVPSDLVPKDQLTYVPNSVVYLLPDEYAVLKDGTERLKMTPSGAV